MGEVAKSAIANGGKVIGVITQALVDQKVAFESLAELRIVKDMHERKSVMVELSDGFIALPGGYGTYEEFFEEARKSKKAMDELLARKRRPPKNSWPSLEDLFT
jgi:uncharacterized protein (TIGR00730 family)